MRSALSAAGADPSAIRPDVNTVNYTFRLVCLSLLFLSPSVRSDPVLRVNCSGSEYVASNGDLYLEDRPYTPGLWGLVNGQPAIQQFPVERSNDVALFTRYTRSDGRMIRYRFDVSAGLYVIVLYMHDPASFENGMNVFSVSINGETVLDSLDVFSQVGRDYAFDAAFVAEAGAEGVDLRWAAHAGAARVAAISVTGVDELPAAPVPAGTEIHPGIGEILLSWQEPPSPAGGYIVERKETGGDFEPVADIRHMIERYVDRDVIAGRSYEYAVRARGLDRGLSAPASVGTARAMAPQKTGLRSLELTLTDEDLRSLLSRPTLDTEYPALFRATDRKSSVALQAFVRFRGTWGRRVAKKDWRVEIAGNLFEGRRVLKLRGLYTDPSLVRERAGFGLAERAGMLHFRTEPVLLFVNGLFQGLYLDVEHADERFVARAGLPEGTTVIKANGNLGLLPPDAYREAYDEEAGSGGLEDLIGLIEFANGSSDADFLRFLPSYVDLYDYLRYYAFLVFTDNRDFATQNYYLVKEPGERWRPVPWDLDLSMGKEGIFGGFTYRKDGPVRPGTRESPDFIGYNVLLDRILSFPQYGLMYARILERLLMDFPPEALSSMVDSLFSETAVAAGADLHKRGAESLAFASSDARAVSGWIPERHRYLAEAAQGWIEAAGERGLRINEFMASNTRTAADPFGDFDDWIELYNAGLDTVALGGLYLSDDLRRPKMWRLPDVALAPGGFFLVWADGEIHEGPDHASFALDKDGEALALWDRRDDGNGLLDWALFGSQTPDVSMGRPPGEEVSWSLLEIPTPGAPNNSTGPSPAPGPLRLVAGPIPASPSDVIRLRAGPVHGARIDILDVLGRRVARLDPAGTEGGEVLFEWRPGPGDVPRERDRLPGSVYFARLICREGEARKKLILLP